MGLFENDPLLLLPFILGGCALWDGLKLAVRRTRHRRVTQRP